MGADVDKLSGSVPTYGWNWCEGTNRYCGALIRSILIQALTADDLESFIVQLKAVAGEENAAIVLKMLSEMPVGKK
ncbi:MAG: hypothetical protein FWE24_09200 [Defluviitaleaceae bacterium]|nr:hypothetical protein [Defluviitaleaceae bacterium]